MPNFESIGQKMRALEGLKVFHKTGSGTKSRAKFKNRPYPKVSKKWARGSCKVSGKSNKRKINSDILKETANPLGGEYARERRGGKLST